MAEVDANHVSWGQIARLVRRGCTLESPRPGEGIIIKLITGGAPVPPYDSRKPLS
jgi:hypothetical protein